MASKKDLATSIESARDVEHEIVEEALEAYEHFKSVIKDKDSFIRGFCIGFALSMEHPEFNGSR